MDLVFFEIALIFVLLLLNGLFSMSELAVVSARRIRLQQQAAEGRKGAQTAIELAENPSRFLSTVQIGITLVGILAGAFGGGLIAELLGAQIARIPPLAPYGTVIAFALVIAVITYFSIIIGELIPKSLALNAPEKIAVLVARPMRLLSRISAPLVWLLTAPTALFLRLLRVRASVDPPVTDEEIKGLIDAGTKAGVFMEAEQDLLESVIHLSDQRVTALMTPRTKIVWLDLDAPDAFRSKLAARRFSRYPVARGTLDNLIGYAAAKELLGDLIENARIDPPAVLKQPLYLPETLTILEVLERFRESHTHLAVIVDEFGGVEGLVTINDVLEAIVGELAADPHRPAEAGTAERPADGTRLLDGRMSFAEFREEFGVGEPPADERGRYQTLAGFALARFGRIPQVGDRFRWENFEFEIVSMERNRIERIARRPVAAAH